MTMRILVLGCFLVAAGAAGGSPVRRSPPPPPTLSPRRRRSSPPFLHASRPSRRTEGAAGAAGSCSTTPRSTYRAASSTTRPAPTPRTHPTRPKPAHAACSSPPPNATSPLLPLYPRGGAGRATRPSTSSTSRTPTRSAPYAMPWTTQARSRGTCRAQPTSSSCVTTRCWLSFYPKFPALGPRNSNRTTRYPPTCSSSTMASTIRTPTRRCSRLSTLNTTWRRIPHRWTAWTRQL